MIKEKKVFKIALSLIAAGAVLLCCGYIFGGCRIIYGSSNGFTIKDSKDGEDSKDRENSEDIVNERKNIEKFSNINLDIDYGDVEIENGSEFAIETVFRKSEDEITYNTSDDTLSVVGHKKKDLSFTMNLLENNNGKSRTKIKIYVPEGSELYEIKSMMSCGDISINGLTFKNGTVTCGYGDTLANDINCSNFTICNKCGNISLNNIKSTDIKANSDYGDVTISDLDTSSFSCDLKCGDININGELKGDNTIDSEYGDVKITTSLSEKEYSYDFAVKFGSLIVNGNEKKDTFSNVNENISNKINAICKSGDMEINFSDH